MNDNDSLVDIYVMKVPPAQGDVKPLLVIITGNHRTGKTFIRRRAYNLGYVHLDAGEIFIKYCCADNEAFGKKMTEKLNTIGIKIIRKSIATCRNIVMEFTGDNHQKLMRCVKEWSNHGYKWQHIHTECEIMESYKRSYKSGENSISSESTDPYHLRWLIECWNSKHDRPGQRGMGHVDK